MFEKNFKPDDNDEVDTSNNEVDKNNTDSNVELSNCEGKDDTTISKEENRIKVEKKAPIESKIGRYGNLALDEEPSYEKMALKLINTHLNKLEDANDVEIWYPCDNTIPEDLLGPIDGEKP
ncbi:18142_t:CDS:2, partial [Dentiscutata erythropus]